MVRIFLTMVASPPQRKQILVLLCFACCVPHTDTRRSLCSHHSMAFLWTTDIHTPKQTGSCGLRHLRTPSRYWHISHTCSCLSNSCSCVSHTCSCVSHTCSSISFCHTLLSRSRCVFLSFQFTSITNAVYHFANSTTSRVPFTDW